MMRFNSCVHAICVWWLVSVGISLFLYFLYSLISQILEWANQQQTRRNSCQPPSFDDVIEVLKGNNPTFPTL